MTCAMQARSHAIHPGETDTFSLFASVSNSAILAHFCQKLGSSKEISVLFPEATKLACEGDKN